MSFWKETADPIAAWLGEWSQTLNPASALLRLALIVLLASIIGCERSSKRHSAGLRTFVLVAFGSAGAMLLDLYWMQRTGFGMPLLSAATVMAAALVSIKSILFSSRNQIKGLTTSAGLWTCSILGFTAGAGLYTVTLLEFVFLLCILAGFPAFERYLKNRSNHFEIHLELKGSEYVRDFITVSRRLGLRVRWNIPSLSPPPPRRAHRCRMWPPMLAAPLRNISAGRVATW